MILAFVALSQYTGLTDRQMTYYDNSQTLQCNCNVRIITSRLDDGERILAYTLLVSLPSFHQLPHPTIVTNGMELYGHPAC